MTPGGNGLGRAVLELATDSAAFFKDLDQAERKALGLGGVFDRVSKDLKGFGDQSARLGGTLTTFVTLPLIAIAGASGKMARDLNAGMANVATLIPKSTARVNELKTAVQAMAVETGKSTDDLTAGLYQTISAFGDTADTTKILEINAKAAAAGLATTTDAINLTSAVTKGYGDSSAEAVQKASDLAFVTVRLGQTTFPELAGSIGKVVPIAKQLGVAQEELFAVMATGTGVTGNASEVSTQLRGVLKSLMSPTSEMTALLQSMGVSSGEAAIKQFGLKGTIDQVLAAAEASGRPLQKYIGEIEGQTLALTLAGSQSDVYTQKLAAMGQAADASAEAFAEQTTGVNRLGFAWSQLQQYLAVLAQRLGDALAPAFSTVTSLVRLLLPVADGLLTVFSALPVPIQLAGVVLLSLAAAAGPVLYVLGQLILAGHAVGTALTASGAAATTAAVAKARAAAAAAVLVTAEGRVAVATALVDQATQKYGATSVQATAARARLAGAEATVAAVQLRTAAATAGATAAQAAAVQRAGLFSRILGTVGLSATAAAGGTGMLASAIAFLTNPITLVVGGLGLTAYAIYKVATAESELEKSIRTNAKAFKEKTDRLDDALRTYDSLKQKQSLTRDETLKLEKATRELAAASGMTVERFEREAAATDQVTDALKRQRGARRDLLELKKQDLRDAWHAVEGELQEAQSASDRSMPDRRPP